ncbi:hypothetical protein SAMN04488490_4024 [Marinobacter sp. LV10R510-11A]|nr:hypothetical protein SAMN04488490_4024 [Marinobacter sp. LV10R510-11A]
MGYFNKHYYSLVTAPEMLVYFRNFAGIKVTRQHDKYDALWCCFSV